MSEVDDVHDEINRPTGPDAYFKPHKTIEVNAELEIVITGKTQWHETAYPIKDKDFTWRFKLDNGQVWDVANSNRKVILKGLHPNEPGDLVPAKFKLINHGAVKNKKPAIEVVFVENV